MTTAATLNPGDVHSAGLILTAVEEQHAVSSTVAAELRSDAREVVARRISAARGILVGMALSTALWVVLLLVLDRCLRR